MKVGLLLGRQSARRLTGSAGQQTQALVLALKLAETGAGNAKLPGEKPPLLLLALKCWPKL